MSDATEDDAAERRFHFTEGESHKFWAVGVTGTRQTVRFGRIGTAGQERTKSFADADEARAATERLVAEKLARGYRPVTAAEADSASAKPLAPRRRRVETSSPWRQLSLPFGDTASEEPAPAPAPATPPREEPGVLALDF